MLCFRERRANSFSQSKGGDWSKRGKLLTIENMVRATDRKELYRVSKAFWNCQPNGVKVAVHRRQFARCGEHCSAEEAKHKMCVDTEDYVRVTKVNLFIIKVLSVEQGMLLEEDITRMVSMGNNTENFRRKKPHCEVKIWISILKLLCDKIRRKSLYKV